MADSFRKCLGDKSATLTSFPCFFQHFPKVKRFFLLFMQGSLYYQPKLHALLFSGNSPKITSHICIKFDPPQLGNWMIPAMSISFRFFCWKQTGKRHLHHVALDLRASGQDAWMPLNNLQSLVFFKGSKKSNENSNLNSRNYILLGSTPHAVTVANEG